MIKKIFNKHYFYITNYWLFLFICLITFSGCGSSNNVSNPNINPDSFLIEKPEYTLMIPNTWQETSFSDIPTSIINSLNKFSHAVFRSRSKDNNNYSFIIIQKVPKIGDKSAIDFAKMNIEDTKSKINDMFELDQKEVVLDNQKTIRAKFVSKVNAELSKFRYWQIFLVKNNTGFVFTGANSVDSKNNNEQELLSILKSIILK